MNKEFYKFKTSFIKALANPVRLMIIDCLKNGQKSVTEIIEMIKEEQSTVSKHLSILKSQGLIQDEKKGLNVYYSLKCTCIKDFFECLDNMINERIENQKEIMNRLL